MRFQQSSDTKIIESVLAEASVGDVVTYEQLSKAIGRDVREFAVGSINSARKTLQAEKQIVFECETKVGYRRLSGGEIIQASERDRKKVQRAANKAVNKLTCVDYDKLTPEQQRSHNVASAQLGAIAMLSTKASTHRIEKQISNGKPLAIGETLKMFTES